MKNVLVTLNNAIAKSVYAFVNDTPNYKKKKANEFAKTHEVFNTSDR